MAAIHLRGFLFFSALIPSVIYALVAVLLIWVLSSRLNGEYGYFLYSLIIAIAFSSIFKMGKDIPLLIKNAIHESKFQVTKEDKGLLDRVQVSSFVEHPMKMIVLSSLISSLILFSLLFVFTVMDFNATYVSYSLSISVLPLLIFISLFQINIKAYASLSHGYSVNDFGSIRKSTIRWFVVPESISFLIINLAILIPLNGLSGLSLNDQVFTLIAVICITTWFLFLAINSDVKNQVNGLLTVMNERSDNDLSINQQKHSDPKSYKIKRFSRIKWIPSVLALQLMVFATTKYIFGDSWFYAFLLIAELNWIFIFMNLRASVVHDTYEKIIQFRYPNKTAEYTHKSPEGVVR